VHQIGHWLSLNTVKHKNLIDKISFKNCATHFGHCDHYRSKRIQQYIKEGTQN